MGDGLSWKRLWLLQLRMWCGGFHSSGSGVDPTEPELGLSKLSPGVGAAQSCCLLCLMDGVEECDCLKGQCSPSMDSQVCVE